MKSLLVEEEVLSGETRITVETFHNFLIRPLDSAERFTVVYEGRFPCITHGIPTR
jgi:hypothetical protein